MQLMQKMLKRGHVVVFLGMCLCFVNVFLGMRISYVNFLGMWFCYVNIFLWGMFFLFGQCFLVNVFSILLYQCFLGQVFSVLVHNFFLGYMFLI